VTEGPASPAPWLRTPSVTLMVEPAVADDGATIDATVRSARQGWSHSWRCWFQPSLQPAPHRRHGDRYHRPGCRSGTETVVDVVLETPGARAGTARDGVSRMSLASSA
jgi:hypothetical protein